jgi:hypothetical protein
VSTVKAVTARRPYECDTCYWTASLRGVATILPGHRYLLHTAFPGDPGFEEGERPARNKECIACAGERDLADQLVAGACGTFCHGTTPCALPIGQGSPSHEHSCKKCAIEAAGAVTR